MILAHSDQTDRPVEPDVSEDFVPIAEVVKAVGLRGELKLFPLLDWHAPLLQSEFLVWDDGRAVAVIGSRLERRVAFVRVAGCDDRDQAEMQVGRRLGFRRESYQEPSFPRPPEGLPFRYLEREVRLVSGETVGWVEEVRRYVDQITLVIHREGREVLIPALAPILRPDVGLTGPLVIDPPEGLLDVAGD